MNLEVSGPARVARAGAGRGRSCSRHTRRTFVGRERHAEIRQLHKGAERTGRLGQRGVSPWTLPPENSVSAISCTESAPSEAMDSL